MLVSSISIALLSLMGYLELKWVRHDWLHSHEAGRQAGNGLIFPPKDIRLALNLVDHLRILLSRTELHFISSLTIWPPSFKLTSAVPLGPHILIRSPYQTSACSLSSQGNS